MEFPHITIEKQEEAIRHLESTEMFSPIEEFNRQIIRAVDTAIIELLDRQEGKDWRSEDVRMILTPIYDTTQTGNKYEVLYKDRYIGAIRTNVAVQGYKTIGNIYIELKEEKNSID